MKILIMAAHPDDEVLGCGATAVRLAREGHTVIPILICESASVRYETKMQNYLEECALKSAQILSISKPIFLGLPDQKLDTITELGDWRYSC